MTGAWMAASETVALDALGFAAIDEPLPGEVLYLRAGQAPLRHQLEEATPAPCVLSTSTSRALTR